MTKIRKTSVYSFEIYNTYIFEFHSQHHDYKFSVNVGET
jgi:hypothetical protein